MSYERVMGLEVIDDEVYQQYREAMKPILETFGGAFKFDFIVSDALLPDTKNTINRVFAIRFPSEQHMKDFFTDPDYLAVKAKFFECSVQSATVISLQEVRDDLNV